MPILRVAALACTVLLLPRLALALPFTGRLDVRLGTLAFSIEGSGEAVSTPSALAFTAGGVTTTRVIPLAPFPSLFPIVDVQLGSPAGLTAASFAAGGGPGGGFGGDAPLAGTARLGLFGPPAIATLPVPLGAVGAEGAFTVVTSPLNITVTVSGGGWTTGRASVVNPFTVTGTTGGDFRTPGGAGSLVLVSAAVVDTTIGTVPLPLLARLELELRGEPAPGVPEPGALVLFGLGSLAVARVLGRRQAAGGSSGLASRGPSPKGS